jgi:hypothetical protein
MRTAIGLAVLFVFISTIASSNATIPGQNPDGSLKGVVLEQKLACGPTACLTNFWQDLDGDGRADIVTLYSVGKDGKLKFIMQERIIRKSGNPI